MSMWRDLDRAAEDAPLLSKWRHLKTNTEYVVTGHVLIEATCTAAICYQHPYETPETVVWCRPAEEFFDGRFVRIGTPK